MMAINPANMATAARLSSIESTRYWINSKFGLGPGFVDGSICVGAGYAAPNSISEGAGIKGTSITDSGATCWRDAEASVGSVVGVGVVEGICVGVTV
jgi:hypothetical protein